MVVRSAPSSSAPDAHSPVLLPLKQGVVPGAGGGSRRRARAVAAIVLLLLRGGNEGGSAALLLLALGVVLRGEGAFARGGGRAGDRRRGRRWVLGQQLRRHP